MKMSNYLEQALDDVRYMQDMWFTWQPPYPNTLDSIEDALMKEIDRQREARASLELARMGASMYNSDGTGERRAMAAMQAYDYALRFFPAEAPKPGPLHLWREMGAW